MNASSTQTLKPYKQQKAGVIECTEAHHALMCFFAATRGAPLLIGPFLLVGLVGFQKVLKSSNPFPFKPKENPGHLCTPLQTHRKPRTPPHTPSNPPEKLPRNMKAHKHKGAVSAAPIALLYSGLRLCSRRRSQRKVRDCAGGADCIFLQSPIPEKHRRTVSPSPTAFTF